MFTTGLVLGIVLATAVVALAVRLMKPPRSAAHRVEDELRASKRTVDRIFGMTAARMDIAAEDYRYDLPSGWRNRSDEGS